MESPPPHMHKTFTEDTIMSNTSQGNLLKNPSGARVFELSQNHGEHKMIVNNEIVWYLWSSKYGSHNDIINHLEMPPAHASGVHRLIIDLVNGVLNIDITTTPDPALVSFIHNLLGNHHYSITTGG